MNLAKTMHGLKPNSVFEILVQTAGLLILALIGQTAWSFFDKLRSFPGPVAAKCSSFWLVQRCRRTRRSESVMALHRKYGDFVRVAPNHISINRPEAVAEIYGHKTGFVKSDFYDAFLQVTPVVFNCRGVPTHQRKRKYMNPAFSARALQDFEPYMDEELRKWQAKLLEMTEGPDQATVLDFAVWTNYLAFDVIGSFAFGKSFDFISKGRDDINLISTIDMRGEVLNALGAVPVWLRGLMKYNVFDRWWYRGLRATANLEKIGRAAYHQRKASPDTRKDLLSYFFAAQRSNSDVSPDELEIIAESISFIVGGSDTTSSTMTNFIDMVSRDRDLQRRIQMELDSAYPDQKDEDWVPSEKEILQKQPLLLATLREVMRFRPTSATGLPRLTPKGGKVICGQFIPEGTVVSVPTCGPRACIGRNFAWMEILKALVVVFRHFDVQRDTLEATVIREGFFNKAEECKVCLSRRQKGQ
ncbi:hypothetical protein B0A52_03509 [Exophiala mesophila]|uniref:Cytochrome P450 n=1 Tax=Exophiala mesophila TaxID=212818 RepID=A0A438N5V0_EXOME|nr:hypothetical protein B0A52_03509 [Exophiala mesophila]